MNTKVPPVGPSGFQCKIMPHLRGKMAVTQPLQERFWIFKVQMTTKVPPLTASGSQWNPAMSQSENGCNSAMS